MTCRPSTSTREVRSRASRARPARLADPRGTARLRFVRSGRAFVTSTHAAGDALRMSPPPATAAAPPAPSRAPARLWIDGPWRDLALYIGVPFLLVPIVLLFGERPDVQDLLIYLE